MTTEYGALLVFDEVMTGFRISYGGARYGGGPRTLRGSKRSKAPVRRVDGVFASTSLTEDALLARRGG